MMSERPGYRRKMPAVVEHAFLPQLPTTSWHLFYELIVSNWTALVRKQSRLHDGRGPCLLHHWEGFLRLDASQFLVQY